MHKINKIFRRLTESLVRSRILPFLLSVQNIIFAILVLIFANVIISKGRVSGELDYDQIKSFYNIVTYLLFSLSFLYAPYFLAGSLNSLVKSNTIDHLLSAKFGLKEITYATFLRGLSNVLILVISAFPIATVSLYFGGVGLIRAIRIIVSILAFAVFLSSISLFLSSLYSERNVSILISYVISFFILVFHLFFIRYIVNIGFITFLYAIFMLLASLFFIVLSYKGRVFNM